MNRSNWDVFLLYLCFFALLGWLAATLHVFGLPLAVSALCGVLIAVAASAAAFRFRHTSVELLIGGFAGAVAGTVLGLLIASALREAVLLQGGTR